MISIPGYQITEQLHESANSYVYRALRKADDRPVVLKILKQDYPPPEKIAWFKREYETTHNLNDINGVVDIYGLENDQNRFFMILEDLEATSVDRLKLAGQMSLTDFLTRAISVTDILGQLHQRYLIHKDINPSNILLNTKTGQIKLIDFGISTVLSRENATFSNPNLLEGTLAYLSPEQTGRMNRSIDYRTDFYSLGVTFYELLTGQLPFPMSDALEVVHCHIARQPVPPHSLKSEIPETISDIVLKLMAKNAENRYQSTYGFKADLEECLRQWQTAGRIEPFPIGRSDVSDRFEIPQKLYGREAEIAALMAGAERVSQGASEMMLVAGYSGIGKSALVQEIYKPLTRQRGYFIAGKFDQFQRDIPYASLLQAFQSLMRQLLTESEAAIATWRDKLINALGANGQIIIEVIPELERIIGPQPAIPTLGPTEAQNRFNFVFQNFINVFTQAEHPLVMFLDDLQWADGASLKLIQLLMTAPDSHYLFLMGAYRDNEVSPGHPLMLTLEDINKANALVNTMTLSPLTLPHLTELMIDIFHCQPKAVKPLAELVQSKTGGNPFFVNEFLKSLYAEALVTFDYQQGGWQWDLTKIQAQQITDNVVGLMADKIQKLPSATQAVLKLAACIGNQFDLERLAMVSEQSARDTAADLWAAITEGFVLPQSDAYKLMELDVAGLSEQVVASYRFAHDRIQQAAYSLISEADKPAVHLRVGQLLLRNTPTNVLEQNIFEIVNQLNQGRTFIVQPTERETLAQLNLKAGKKAKASAAYQPAFNYLQVGRNLLEENHWQQQYDLALELYLETAEAAYLSTHFDEMARLTDIVQQQAKTLLDQVKAYELQIQSEMSQLQFQSAIAIALDVLKKLGISMSPAEIPARVLVDKIQQTLTETNKQIEDLFDIPEMTNPNKLAAIRILLTITGAIFAARPSLYPQVPFHMVTLSMKYGNPPVAAGVYALYGSFLSGTMNELDAGYRFGQLGVRLLNKFDIPQLKAMVLHSFNSFTKHWKKPLKDTIESLQEGVNCGLETGNLEQAGYAAICYCEHLLFTGLALEGVEQKYAQYTDSMVNKKQVYSIYYMKIDRQIVLNLQGKSVDKCRLVSEDFNESEFLPIFIEQNNLSLLFVAYLAKTILPYFFKDYAQAVENARLGAKYEQNNGGMIVTAQHNFYHSLALLAHYPDADTTEQTQYLKELEANQQKMKHWVSHAPMNYQHKYDLIEAEKARVLGNVVEAMALYDKAIQGARDNQYPHEEALAYERAAEFYLALGRQEIAQLYMKKAHYGYVQWGATAKVQDLEAEYPQLLSQPITTSDFRLSSTTITGTRSGEALDLAAVMKASQAISGEMVLDKLLAQLMNVVIENAGAQKGCLILKNADGDWAIEAEGVVDSDEVTTRQSLPIDSEEPRLSAAIVNYVARTQESVVLNDAVNEGEFTAEAYIVAKQPKSLLCTPLLNQGQLSGLLYLENNLTTGAFTADRLEVLQLLSSQAAISIDNAKLYTEMAELNDELKEMDRLKDDFLANTSHELRTPLNGIIGITQSLLEGAGGPLTDEQITNLQMVVSSGKRLDTLVNYILDFSKLKRQEIELQRKPIDFRQLTQLVMSLSKPLLGGKPLELQNQIADDLPPVYGDENRLQQIMHNLIGNAIKFTASGEVTVTAQVTEDNRIEITVADTGIGIPTDKFDDIFKSFEQVDASTAREYGGTGLGLSITKQLVELHGGTISVASELGHGSQFTLTLQKSRESAAPLTELPEAVTKVRDDEISRRAVAPQPLKAEGDYTILAVDDDPVNLQVVTNLLSIENYAVKTVLGGAETFELLEQGEKPDLILLDIMMPKITGYEVCQKLRERYSATELPIMLLTAKNQVSDLVDGLNVGANDYITKPVSKHELLARIKTHINLSRLKAENIRMGAELEVARRVQQMLLPKEHELTQVTGLEIAGFMEPAEEVGGDYYDVLVSNGRIKLAIGDATGHGLESGILAIMVQTAVRTLLEHGETDPVKFLTTLNRTIYDNVERMRVEKNMTLSLLEYVEGGKLRLSGQHEDIIFVQNGELSLIDTFDLGFPVGLEQDITDFVSEQEIRLNSGDVVVFYTDGITEAENLEKEQYGMDRLCEIIQQNWQRSVNEIKQAVIDDVRQYIGKQVVFDDITLLVLKQQ